MGRRNASSQPLGGQPLRALPRAFVPGATTDAPFALPKEEIDKFRHVLRLGTGDEVAILPNDGTVIRCRLEGLQAVPIERTEVHTESQTRMTLLQALPKPEAMETLLRCCTELGVSSFVLFPSERSVPRWDGPKLEDRLRRCRSLVREAAEQSFRARLPEVSWVGSLQEALESEPNCIVFNEREDVETEFSQDWRSSSTVAVVIGPEGGWAPREAVLIAERSVTIGPRVLRVDTAAIVAAALVLAGS